MSRTAVERGSRIADTVLINAASANSGLTVDAGTPLSAEHLRILGDARKKTAKVRRTAGVAAFSGWTMALFAASGLVFGVFGDLSSLAVGVGLGVAAVSELRGAAMVRRLNPAGCRWLALNQILVAAVLVGYAAWSYVAARRSAAALAVGGTGDPDIDAMVGTLTTVLPQVIYGAMAVLGVIIPALTAWYYARRGAMLRQLLASTPAWTHDVMRTMG